MSETDQQYCREVEAYLCRKNDGHLIRIVGPAFERVCGWSERGVPIAVAFRGIDRYFERYYAKGPRRRPVRLEFCEADVLDVFDEWRRAVGVDVGTGRGDIGPVAALDENASGPVGAHEERGDLPDSGRHRSSLPAHLDRAIDGLTALRGSADPTFDRIVDAAIRELEEARAGARGLRGTARRVVLERLQALDAELLEGARGRTSESALAEIGEEADRELAPFRARMTNDAYQQSRVACIGRLLRERARLPFVAFE